MSCEYSKVQAREASLVGSYINMSDLYKSYFTSEGFAPLLTRCHFAEQCCPMRICKDREVSQQCASSTCPLPPCTHCSVYAIPKHTKVPPRGGERTTRGEIPSIRERFLPVHPVPSTRLKASFHLLQCSHPPYTTQRCLGGGRGSINEVTKQQFQSVHPVPFTRLKSSLHS